MGSTAAEAQGPPGDTAAVLIDTLRVTVLRTPFVAERAPYAVTVVGADEIRRARPGFALDEALAGVPGVQVDNRYNLALGERISIRGFGARAQFGVRGVRVVLDGIPATLPDGQTTLNQVDLGGLARAEVLRGPSSALYGNAAGGVILLESAFPDGVSGRVIGGADGLRRTEAAAGAPWGGVRVSHFRYGGFRDWSGAETLRGNARARFGGLGVVANVVRYDARNPGSLSDSLLRVDRTQAYGYNVRQRTAEVGTQAQLGATWSGAVGPAALELAGYGLTREIDNPIPPRIIDLERTAGGVRALARLEAGSARWTVGVEGDGQRDDRLNFVNEQGDRGERVLDQRERVTSAAGFTQVALSLGERLDLLGSLRHDRFRFDVRDRLVSATDPDDTGSRTMGETSGAAGASLEVLEGLHLYGNVATAFETPTTTELANRPSGAGGFNPELAPQRTRSVEAGAKGRIGPVASFQVAAYRARVRDALIPFEVPGAEGRQFFRNAGSTVNRGLELGISATPVRGVRTRLAYTVTDARFERYAVGEAVHDGNRVPGVAPRRLEALASLTLPRGAFLDLEGRYASRTPVDDANRHHSPAYFVADARVGVEEMRVGRAAVSPFLGVGNLFGAEYNSSVVVNAFGRRFYEPGPGRTLHVGAEVRL